MEYHIEQDVFDRTFISGDEKKFSHKTNRRFNMFPFTGSSSDEVLNSFDNILGAFLRTLYSFEEPEEINCKTILSSICNDVAFSGVSPVCLQSIIKDLYFINDNTIRCTNINTYKHMPGTKNNQKISEYLVSAICDADVIKQALEDGGTSNNILDSLFEEHLPELKPMKNNVNYLSLIPQIKEYFTKDLVFLIKNKNTDFFDIVQLMSYYYFFYTSQVILNLNRFGSKPTEIIPVFFCTEWERTSKSRECFQRGWKQIESKLKTMFSHAVLLEMLNQTSENCKEKYDYYSLIQEYNSASGFEKVRVFSEIEELKNKYTTVYVKPESFEYKLDNYKKGNLESLIKGFFDDIMLQFESSNRNRANDAYKKGFYDFSRNNYIQNRRVCGLMLALNEDLLILMTKVSIGHEKQVQLNKLFEEFNKRGIYMDKQTQESIVEFYEKLNLIEKKSDSGDAQYVKGIL